MLEFTIEQLLERAPFTEVDRDSIMACRGEHNRLGFAYQLAFVRFYNRMPMQTPFELVDDLVAYAAAHWMLSADSIDWYGQRRKTLSDHQESIRCYLDLSPFTASLESIEAFLFKEACQLEQINSLVARLKQFFRTNQILEPSNDTMVRVIRTQRELTRAKIYQRITRSLSLDAKSLMDALLLTEAGTYSDLHQLKQAPGNPSPASLIKLTSILERIDDMNILSIELSWLNNNFKRSLAHYARQASIYRLKRLTPERRYAVLICFLHQLHLDTFDAMVQMHDKLMNKIYNKADKDVEAYMKSRRRQIRKSLQHYKAVLNILLNGEIEQKDIRKTVFNELGEEALTTEMETIEELLGNNYSSNVKRVVARFSYLRQFSLALLKHLVVEAETSDIISEDIVQAAALLNDMNAKGKHKLPADVPTSFIPKKWRSSVIKDGRVDKAAWECSLLSVLRDQIKSGNFSVPNSKRYAKLDTFFMPKADWEARRESFFARAGLPADPAEVTQYLTDRLNQVYDQFLTGLPDNPYAQVDENGWRISSDPTEKLDFGDDKILNPLKAWLGKHLRTIKLPDLLIEVDNEVQFTRHFMPNAMQSNPSAQEICEVLATVMAHASEVGSYTMSQLIDGMSYDRMKHITEWHMHEDSQRGSLALVVNAISQLDITKAWGDGTTSSSDAQRFSLRRRVLQKSYSHAFNDFALEFHNFVADNYAPYFSDPHECTDRDAPYVLDGILYNQSDLDIQEHYTDTHGFTDINFAAFAMLGKRFVPRIKGLKKHSIFYIDTQKDYGQLSILLNKRDRLLHPEWIVEQWDRMGHF